MTSAQVIAGRDHLKPGEFSKRDEVWWRISPGWRGELDLLYASQADSLGRNADWCRAKSGTEPRRRNGLLNARES
jgi:hypothetical protein